MDVAGILELCSTMAMLTLCFCYFSQDRQVHLPVKLKVSWPSSELHFRICSLFTNEWGIAKQLKFERIIVKYE